MNSNQYDELIGKIYDAALTPRLWGVFLEEIAEIFHSNGALIYLVDFSNHSAISRSDDISFIRSVRMPPDLLRDYDRYYSKVNIWLERSKNLPVGVPVPTATLFPEDELSHTEWYNDWLKPSDYYRCLIGHLLQQDALTVRMSIFRNKQHQFEKNEIALLARLMPHLQRSCLFYKNIADLRSDQRTHTNLLNRLSVGVVLFDRYGQAIFVNQAVESLTRTDHGFRLDAAGRCHAGNAEQTRELRRRLAHVLDYGRSRVMTLQHPKASHPLHAIILPLHDQSLLFFDSGPSAALFICDPNTRFELDESVLAEIYGFTPAEAKLASALVSGQNLSDYEKSRGVRHNTAKTQLKQVLAKTDTHRQTDLIQLITRCFANLPSP